MDAHIYKMLTDLAKKFFTGKLSVELAANPLLNGATHAATAVLIGHFRK